METKRTLRQLIRERKRLSNADCNELDAKRIWQEVESKQYFKDASNVMIYWSLSDEVETHVFIEKWYKKKTILLPCINGDDLDIRSYKGRESLHLGEQLSILEPVGDLWSDVCGIDLIFVPGMAFDMNGNRLGRGRGFYDRLLPRLRCKKVGICYPWQMVSQVPVDDFDVRMDEVIF